MSSVTAQELCGLDTQQLLVFPCLAFSYSLKLLSLKLKMFLSPYSLSNQCNVLTRFNLRRVFDKLNKRARYLPLKTTQGPLVDL